MYELSSREVAIDDLENVVSGMTLSLDPFFFFFFFFLNHTPFDPLGLAGNKLSSYSIIYKKLCALLPPYITPAFAFRYYVNLLC
jgi:hypothetical protein